MGPIDALIHLLNFLSPALVLGGIGAGLAKLVWRQELRPVRWWRLASWASGASAVVSVMGLIVWGRDGRMATYAAMVLACAAALWWGAFGPSRR